mmetsp:Transcript_8525/g.24259  ORF Transcript_8525/g.24259 Transcript_8525/m.24259 type:complete len:263 (+) Transcript_8525:871-1659(+)
MVPSRVVGEDGFVDDGGCPTFGRGNVRRAKGTGSLIFPYAIMPVSARNRVRHDDILPRTVWVLVDEGPSQLQRQKDGRRQLDHVVCPTSSPFRVSEAGDRGCKGQDVVLSTAPPPVLARDSKVLLPSLRIPPLQNVQDCLAVGARCIRALVLPPVLNVVVEGHKKEVCFLWVLCPRATLEEKVVQDQLESELREQMLSAVVGTALAQFFALPFQLFCVLDEEQVFGKVVDVDFEPRVAFTLRLWPWLWEERCRGGGVGCRWV